MADRYTYDEEVVLIGTTEATNAAGDTVSAETRTASYAQIVSPYMKETYEGKRQWQKSYHITGSFAN